MSKTFILTIALCVLTAATAAVAQRPDFQFPGYPGAPTTNYYQPVKIRGPEGTQIALAAEGRFVERQAIPFAVGLLVGEDYRVRITNIPQRPGKEVFPTIKLIGRTFPPRGQELEFPIPIEITEEDIELALNGRFITRVVYLEDPQNALPLVSNPQVPLSTDVNGGADPIDVASTMGRPVAIIRLGGRVPDINGADWTFFHGCPNWIAFDKSPEGFLMTRYEKFPQPTPRISSTSQPRLY